MWSGLSFPPFPCSPCSPKLLYVLPSGMVGIGWGNLPSRADGCFSSRLWTLCVSYLANIHRNHKTNWIYRLFFKQTVNVEVKFTLSKHGVWRLPSFWPSSLWLSCKRFETEGNQGSQTGEFSMGTSQPDCWTRAKNVVGPNFPEGKNLFRSDAHIAGIRHLLDYGRQFGERKQGRQAG